MSTDAVRMSQWPSDQRFVIPVAPGPDVVTVTIDGKEVQAPRGELLIKVAQEHGTYIPRFCWHERMKPVGMCRMCLVEVEGMRGMQISCATPVSDGMVVNTQSPNVKAVQDGVLEFLLINHPLDCPVCDRGGECPLQDQTLAFGPGESRFVEEKRHFEKPVPISDLVLLDRERCIQCGRCTRFAAEIAGDPLIDFGERGANTQVITYPDEPFSSYFSGNTVQICPVGALTASAYRFRARPWDLQTVETSCTTCAVGCRGALQSTSNRIVRLLGVDSEPVNHGWLCDKGRYGYEWVHSGGARARADGAQERGAGRGVVARGARRRRRPGCRPRSTRAARRRSRCSAARGAPTKTRTSGPRFAKGVLGTDNVDAQLGDGLPAEVVLGLPGATIADIDRARAVVLVAPDLREELPVLHLRVRRAAVELGVPVIELAPRASGLTRDVTAVLRHAPGEAGAMAEQFARALAGDGTASGQRIDREGGQRARRARRRHRRRARAPVARGVAGVGRAGRRRARRAPGREVPLRAASRQRARRTRPRPHAGLPAGASHPRRRPRRATPTRGAACPRRPGSTPPACSKPPRPARSTRWCCSAPSSRKTSPTGSACAPGSTR